MRNLLSILFMRSRLMIRLVESLMHAFNSLYEIQTGVHGMAQTPQFSFNSLYEIFILHAKAYIVFYSFNSLYEINMNTL